MVQAATVGYVPEEVSTPASKLMAQIVRNETHRKGLSMTGLMESTGVSRNALYRLLRGDLAVTGKVLRPIERELELPTMFLDEVREGDVERVRAAVGVRADLLKWALDELDPTAEIVQFPGPRATSERDGATAEVDQAAARRRDRKRKSSDQ